jgi:hypothetical protein
MLYLNNQTFFSFMQRQSQEVYLYTGHSRLKKKICNARIVYK